MSHSSMKKIGAPITVGKTKYVCQHCQKPFERYASNNGSKLYCSRKCSNVVLKGKPKTVTPLGQREWRPNSKGYLQTTIRRKRIYHHRWVMENHLGRPLTKEEFVHHVDGNKTNNQIDNLLLVTAEQHALSHKEMKLAYWRLLKQCEKVLQTY